MHHTSNELNDLADREDSLLSQLPTHAVGTELGQVERTYRAIHTRYVSLAVSGSLEALKRALFLQWFSCCEPPWLTGLGKLDPKGARQLMLWLDALSVLEQRDSELASMLAYYQSVAAYCFESYPTDNLIAWFESPSGRTDLPTSVCLLSKSSRGQMGVYWASVAKRWT